jgi:hypothetical protein
LRGTFFPFLRASESAIAMACLRLVTLPPFPPLPLRSVPRFFLRIALATILLALGYICRLPDFLAAILDPPFRRYRPDCLQKGAIDMPVDVSSNRAVDPPGLPRNCFVQVAATR